MAGFVQRRRKEKQRQPAFPGEQRQQKRHPQKRQAEGKPAFLSSHLDNDRLCSLR